MNTTIAKMKALDTANRRAFRLHFLEMALTFLRAACLVLADGSSSSGAKGRRIRELRSR